MAPRMDKDFGAYELGPRIGKGGMAWVYQARQKNLDRAVALKILFPHLAEDEKLVARFQLEAKSAAQLRHENICQVYDFGRSGEQFYIAMEYVEGKNLREWIDQHGTPPLEIALLVLRDICRGLEHAHRRNIIHRDIKPSNVMFTPEGVLKLMDFGLARRAEDTTGMTMVGATLGTPAYMSPEQARGEKLDRATTDVFSFGIVCYELLGGTRPFQGDTSSIARAILYSEPRPLDALDPLVPSGVEAMIRRMLEKDATKRVQTVTEVRQAFDAAIEAIGIAHDRDLLADYAADPAKVGGALRARRLARHLENAREAEARGDEAALLREYRCVVFLDPTNAVAMQYVRTHDVGWPGGPATIADLESTMLVEDVAATVVMPSTPGTGPGRAAESPPDALDPEVTTYAPLSSSVPPTPFDAGATTVAPPGSFPSTPRTPSPATVPPPSPPAGAAGHLSVPASRTETPPSSPPRPAPPRPAPPPPAPPKKPAAQSKRGGMPPILGIGAGVVALVIVGLFVWQPWKSRTPSPATPAVPAPSVPAVAPVDSTPAAPGTGTLFVDAAPAGALVSLDGGEFVPAPARFDVEPRDHTVRVRRDSFLVARRVVRIAAGRETTLTVALKPAAGASKQLAMLLVQTNPSDATVRLDGAAPVAAPARFRSVAEGDHTIEVTREGHEPRTLAFVAHAGIESTLTIALVPVRRTPLPARTVNVKAPKGAKVTLDDGTPAGDRARFEHVAQGSHRVRVTLAGSRDADVTFAFSGLRDTTLSVRMESAGAAAGAGATATLILWSRPPGDFWVEQEVQGTRLDSVHVTIPAGREVLVTIRSTDPWLSLTAKRTERLKAGEVRYVGRDFTEDGSRLTVTSPGRAGAEVLVDGRHTGHLTPTAFWVSEGNHKVQVVLDGWKSREGEQSLHFKARQPRDVAFTLERGTP